MKKKYLLTAVCLSACIFGAQAQFPDTYQPRTVDKTNRDIAAIDASGNVIVAGTFTEEFSFGSTDLTAEASSTYLIKYNASGEKQWAVSFKGAATATAMTTDNEGNVYVAGQYAGDVIFNTTSGTPATVTGISDGAEGTVTDLGAGFLAKYSSNGALIKAQAFKPEAFPETAADFENIFFYDQNLQFAIRNLKFVNGTLYASAVFTGILNAGLPLRASYLITEGISADVYAGAVFSVNTSDLNIAQIIATLVPPINQEQPNVTTALFDITSDNLLYALFYATGGVSGSTHTLSISGSTEDFVLSDGSTIYETGHVFAVVNLSGTPSKVSSVKAYLSETRDYEYLPAFARISDDRILLSGTFKNSLVFDNTLTASGTDVFATALNKTDLTKIYAQQAGTANGKFSSAAIYDGKLNIAYNDATAKSSGIFSLALNDGTTAVTPETVANTYTNSLFAANGKLVKVKATTSATAADLSTVTVSSENAATSGINSPKAPAIGFYPNPVTNVLRLSETGNINIYNSLGTLVKQAVAVDRLNVENLPAGVYFARVKTAGNTGTVRFVKK